MRAMLFAAAAVATLASGYAARAGQIAFSFGGNGLSGHGLFTYQPDRIIGDPAGAYNITAVSGTFTDTNIGLTGWKITGIEATNPTPKAPPFPTSLSYFPAHGSLLPPDDTDPHGNPALSYDNLLFLSPEGSPDVCGDGQMGGFLDVMGVLFNITSPDGSQTGALDLWSDGGSPNTADIYGAAVTDSTGLVLEYNDPFVDPDLTHGLTMNVPEPASFLLLGTFAAGMLTFRRRRG